MPSIAGYASGLPLPVLALPVLRPVRAADLIVVMDGGRVVERGTHDELVAAGGSYADLYSIQARAYG